MTKFKFIPKEFEAVIKTAVDKAKKPEGEVLTIKFMQVMTLSEIAYQLRRIADKIGKFK